MGEACGGRESRKSSSAFSPSTAVLEPFTAIAKISFGFRKLDLRRLKACYGLVRADREQRERDDCLLLVANRQIAILASQLWVRSDLLRGWIAKWQTDPRRPEMGEILCADKRGETIEGLNSARRRKQKDLRFRVMCGPARDFYLP